MALQKLLVGNVAPKMANIVQDESLDNLHANYVLPLFAAVNLEQAL